MGNLNQIILRLAEPVFKFIKRLTPGYFQRIQNYARDPYMCGMVRHFNLFHEWIYKPSFRRVRVDAEELKRVGDLSRKGTLVYIMKNRGQLEYSFFNHLFLKENIPLARFANGCRTLFWRPFTSFVATCLMGLDRYYRQGSLADPLGNGYFEELLLKGESALLNLRVSKNFLFGANRDDPLNFIVPLIRAAKKSEKPIYLMTQQFLYDRHPEKADRSLIDVLFGDKAEPGTLRKLILFLWSYKRKSTVKFGEAFDLKEFVSEQTGKTDVELATSLKSILLNRLHVERRSITGPALIPREKLFEKILEHPSWNQDLQALALKLGQKIEALEKMAKTYLTEMGADVHYSAIDFYDWVIHWMVNHIYDGLDVDTESLAKIKNIAGKHPIVMVPAHKSHIDYLLLSYLFYNHDLTLPHVCAGINLKFWPADGLIRKGGGFFIRRSLGDDALYKLTLEHYLKALVREGNAIEFFIEGTRSRTGKLLKPKMGVLAMLMKSYLDGEARDIYFVPVSINYERILEAKSYVSELGGSEKKKENMASLVKVGGKFRVRYGKVYIRFADPLSLKEFFDSNQIMPRSKDIDDCRNLVSEFAYKITYNINKVTVITPSTLVAMSLLHYPKKGIPESEVLRRAEIFKKYLQYKGASFSSVMNTPGDWALREALHKMVSERLVLAHHDFKEKFFTLDETKRPLLEYMKNNGVHFFVSLVCFMKILMTSDKQSLGIGEVEKRYERLKALLRHDFTFSERATLKEHLLKVIYYCVEEGLVRFDQAKEEISIERSTTHPLWNVYSSLLDNFFESALMTLLYIKHVDFKNIEVKKLEKEIMTKGHSLYLKGDLRYPEALSQSNIKNALLVFRDLGLITTDGTEKMTRSYDAQSLNQWEKFLLEVLGEQSLLNLVGTNSGPVLVANFEDHEEGRLN